jgi:hypothetical protein
VDAAAAAGEGVIGCAVLIPSCEAYSDLWRPCLNLFWRHWPDCPFPVYLGSDRLAYDDPRVGMIFSDRGRNWTNQVRDYVERIEAEYVILLLEDFFIRRSIDTAEVLWCVEAARALNAAMLRLVPRPRPDRPVNGYNFGRVDVGAPYRVSTQATLWRRDALLDLFRTGESIWEFEVKGSVRSRVMGDGFYCVYKPIIDYGFHVVERGKWFRKEASRFGRMGIGCDFSRRPIMSVRENLRSAAKEGAAQIVYRLPWRPRVKTIRFLKAAFGLRNVREIKHEGRVL